MVLVAQRGDVKAIAPDRVIDPAFEQFCAQVNSGVKTLLDPYGATAIEEFFAVAAETFFTGPKQMRAWHPDLYGLLARYFQQDPAAYCRT